MKELNSEVLKLLTAIKAEGGTPYLIGGWVRDIILGIDSKDIDVEVYGLSVDSLLSIVTKFGTPKICGDSFGVIKITVGGEDLDITPPRTESKKGKGHKGFIVDIDPFLSLEEATARRDYTMNSLLYNPFDNTIIDIYGGVKDLNNRILRHTSDTHFGDDPLRVPRGAQFESRFKLTAIPETVSICKSLLPEFETLAKERLLEEWDKLLLKGVEPSRGIKFLLDTGWLSKFPVLYALHECKQDSIHHPEGDVLEHICQDLDYAVSIRDKLKSSFEKRVFMYANLLHDVGKPTTTAVINNKITSYGHDQEGEKYAKQFLEQLGMDVETTNNIIPLVTNHMATVRNKPTFDKKFVRRLAVRVAPSNINMLALVMECDSSGRGSIPKGRSEDVAKIVEIANRLSMEIKPPEPFLTGKHLISLGLKPSPEFGRLIRLSFESQLDGKITNEKSAIRWVKFTLFKERIIKWLKHITSWNFKVH